MFNNLIYETPADLKTGLFNTKPVMLAGLKDYILRFRAYTVLIKFNQSSFCFLNHCIEYVLKK